MIGSCQMPASKPKKYYGGKGINDSGNSSYGAMEYLREKMATRNGIKDKKAPRKHKSPHDHSRRKNTQ